MGGQLMSPAQLQHLRNMIMTCMARYPYGCTNWYSHFGRNQQLLVWLKTYSQEGNWVWFWKLSQLPAPNEVIVLGKDSTLVTLPNEHNSLLSSKSYPYTHIWSAATTIAEGSLSSQQMETIIENHHWTQSRDQQIGSSPAPPWMHLHHSTSSLANETLQERRQKNSKRQNNSESVVKQHLLEMTA